MAKNIIKCNKCGKEFGFFSRRYTCNWCGKIFCSDCIQKVSFVSNEIKKLWELDNKEFPEYSVTKFAYVLCPTCSKTFREDMKVANKAVAQSGKVELVSINYKGKKQHSGASRRITSGWHRDKEECREELRQLAALNSFSIVIGVKEESDVRQDGNYKYKVFRMMGEAYNK